MDTIRYSFNLLNHLLIFGLTAAMCWKCLQMRLEKTAMHAFLCTIGFVLLLCEGMMVRYRGNVFTAAMDASSKTSLHLWLQLVGGLLGIIGTVHKVWAKENHFRSLHAKLGLAACVFCAVNFLCGLLALYSHDYRHYVSPLVSQFVHNFLGLVTFLTAMGAQFYGYETGFFRRNFVDQQRPYKFVTIVVTCLSVLGTLQYLTGKALQLLWS